ncbi:MAG: hypothetical protein JSV49_04575 [Thermoplasmata archaeon]|nr:MAG: hypothetical protein JSV49_04575 [Thermoplasmata archaeon]
MIQSKVKMPTLINIDAYIKGDKKEVPDAIGPDDPTKIFNYLCKKLKAEKVDETIIAFSSEKDDWYIKLFDQPDYCVFTTMVSPKDDNYVSDDWTQDITKYIEEMQKVIAVMPRNRIANLRIIGTTGFDEHAEAKTFIDEYAAFFDKRINEIGLMYNFCMLCKDDQIENPPFYMKDYIIAPITPDRFEAERIILEVIDDLNFLAAYEGKLDRMYRVYVDIEAKFKRMENKSIAEMNKVAGILKKDLEVKQLEQYLLKINSEFAEISTLAAVLSHDNSTVTSNISNANVIYSKWNEKEFSGYPKVHIASMRDLEIIANAYKSITEKLEVVRGRLHDTLEIIKTYLDLKQQNLSLQLQKSVDASGRSQIDLLYAQEEEKRMAESSKRSLENLTYIFAGLGLCEVLANFVVVYLTEGSPVSVTAMFLSLTLIIPLVVIWVLFAKLQKRAQVKIESDLKEFSSKMKSKKKVASKKSN